jgi:hypothetical protein
MAKISVIHIPSCSAWGQIAALHELEVASFGLIQQRQHCQMQLYP